MTLPANIRVNVAAPFPSVVKGQAPFSIAKANGIWTLGLSLAGLQVQQPPASNYATDYIFVWDSVAGIFFRMPLAVFASGAKLQRSITAGPVTVQSTDQILNLNLSSPTTITLPSYLLRSGVPLTFKDVGKQAGSHTITLTAAAGELIDGNASIPLNANGQSITLVPANDGVNSGWFEE
jgi:hypothetical protein